MFLDSLNLNNLRVFTVVYRLRSMTKAAKEMHMTQSGVSQHVKGLESALGVTLFDRLQKSLVPTAKAKALYEHCMTGLTAIETGLGELHPEDSRKLSDTISLGMPIEFGNSILLPKIADFCRQYPQVKFRFRIELAPLINQLLIQGELDFAFVDDFTPDRKVQTERVFDEILGLYVHENLLKNRGRPKGKVQDQIRYFESMEYVEYQEGETVLHAWFAHHYPGKNPRLSLRATILDVQGVARLICSGAGAGVLPSHVADHLIRQGVPLYCFPGNGKPLKNSISLASLRGRQQSRAAQAVMQYLKANIGR